MSTSHAVQARSLSRVYGSGPEAVHALRDVDLVIEAVSENLALKQQVFRELDAICPPGTIFASNTSALSISAMGSATHRPGKVIGLHFFNPAYAMPLVEIVPGLATDAETADRLMARPARQVVGGFDRCGDGVERSPVPCAGRAEDADGRCAD